jgi:hypothetical protein
VGDVTVLAAGEKLDAASEIAFQAGGFPLEADAQVAGETLRGWVRLANVAYALGVDVGKDDTFASQLGEAGKARVADALENMGAFLVADVHGLVVYEEQKGKRAMVMSLRASGSWSITGDSLRDILAGVAASTQHVSDKLALACDLVSLSDRETSDRARLVTLVTALEVLSERPERPARVLVCVNDLIDEVKVHQKAAGASEQEAFQSLLGAMKDLKLVSITASTKKQVELSQSGPETGKLITRCYNCRSELVHEGESQEDPGPLATALRPIVSEIIRRAATP